MKHVNIYNLAECTAREVFDHIANHLLRQKQRAGARDDGGRMHCAYLSPSGLRCAAGCLVPVRVLRSLPYSTLIKPWAHLRAVEDFTDQHFILIDRLQKIHDTVAPSLWPRKLKELEKELFGNEK